MTDPERIAAACLVASALRYRLWYLQKWPWKHFLDSAGGIISERDPK